MIAWTKTALICVLALLLLVTPVCGALCQAQACDLLKAAEKSTCHESAGSMTNRAGSSVRAERSCGLQELPVALPADFRSLRSDSAVAADTATSIAIFASSFGHANPTCFSDAHHLQGTDALSCLSPSSVVPLRL
jgi:hypothetical protein